MALVLTSFLAMAIVFHLPHDAGLGWCFIFMDLFSTFDLAMLMI
jgi:hypothetical protein